MSVSRDEMERRRRLAEDAAQEVDPSDIEGLAPPPTSPPKSQKLETQQAPDRRTVSFGPPGTTKQVNLQPPPQPVDRAAEAQQLMQEVRSSLNPERQAEAKDLMRESRKAVADQTAGRVETAASEFGEAAVGMVQGLTEGLIYANVAERQGQGLGAKLGLQPVSQMLFGRELNGEELSRVLPQIENNPVSKWLGEALDFNLGSNPEYLSRPDEEFEVGKFLNSSVPSALGSMSTFVLAGLLTKGAGAAGGLGATGSSVLGGVTASGLGAVIGGTEAAAGVKDKGGTNEQVINAFVLGNLPGLTEGLPIGRALNRLDKGSGGKISRMLKEGFKGSVEELIQEGTQGAATTYIENAILDLDQDLFDRSTKEGAAAGGVAGFLTSFLLTALGGRRAGNRRDGPASRAESEASGQTPPEGEPPTPPEGEPPAPPEAEGEGAIEPSDVSGDTLFGVDPDAEVPEGDVPAPAPETTAIPETYEAPDGRIYSAGIQLEGESDVDFQARLQWEAANLQPPETPPDAAPAPEVAPEGIETPEAAPEQGPAPGVPEAAPEVAPEAIGPEPDRRGEARPDTPETAMQTAVRQLNRGVDSDTETDGTSIIDIPPMPGTDQFSDNEADHQASLAAFMPQIEERGWQLAGQSSDGNSFGYMTPDGDRVEVYKKGAGMGWAVQLRPPESQWKKATKELAPDVDPNLRTQAPRVMDPWRGATPGDTGPQGIVDSLPERNAYLQSVISGLDAEPDMLALLERLEQNPESIDPLSPEGQYLSAQGVLRQNQYKGSTGSAGLTNTGAEVLARMRPQGQPVTPAVPLPAGVPEPEPTTGQLPTGASPAQPQGTQEGRHTVQTSSGERVETQFAVVSADFLTTSNDEGFTQALQPRERGDRQASKEQIQKIIREFDPRQIAGADPTAAAGSPIINDRGEVISGNGRVSALREIFANHPELAQQYQEYVSSTLGVDIGPGEILVQAVAQPQDAAQQRAFVDQANVAAQAKFSRAEKARTDARAIDDAMLSALQPTDITSTANSDFVRAFASALQRRGEDMSDFIQPSGQISAEGRQRIEAALIARALGVTDAQSDSLRRTLEDPDDNTKNVTNAILDSARELAGLQIASEQGNVTPEVAGQIAPGLAQAVETVSMLRRQKRNVQEFLMNMDIEGPRPALVDEFIKSFYDPTLSRPTSRGNMAQIFQVFANEIMRTANTQQGDMLGAQPTAVDPAATLRAAREQVQGAQAAPQQSGLFGPGGNPFGGTPPPAAPTTSTPPAGTTPQAAPQAAPAAPVPSPAAPPTETKVKRGQSFETDGGYDVTLPSGRKVQIFRDTEQFSYPVWHLEPGHYETMGIPEGSPLRISGIGSTQREAIGVLEQLDEQLGGPNVEQQPQQSANNSGGMATPSQQSGQGPNHATSAINSGTVAPGTGTPTEGNQQPSQPVSPDADQSKGLVSGQNVPGKPEGTPTPPEKKSAPGTVNPGPQTNVSNQTKESYEQRGPQYDEKASIFGNDLLEKLEGASEHNRGLPETHPNVSTVAMQINKDIIQNRSVQYIGMKVQTPADMASLAQAYRDPQFETLRYVFLDTNGNVIYQTAVSARLPASVPAQPAGTNGWLKNLFRNMQRNNANYVYMIHNHPSGKSKPSPADIALTKEMKVMADHFSMGLNHIVVNSNEYSTIAPNGSVTTVTADFFEGPDPLLTPKRGMEHDLLGVDMGSNPKQWAAAGKAIQSPGNVTLIGMTPRNEVRAIGEISWQKLKNMPIKQLQKELQSWKVMSGSARLVLAGAPMDTVIFPDALPLSKNHDYVTSAQMKGLSKMGDKLHRGLTRSGIVYDFVDTAGNSALYERQFARPGRKYKDGEKAGINEAGQFYEDGIEAEQIDSEAVRRQRETVQNVRSGQPLDRLFRFMFTGLGIFEDRWLQTNEAGEDPSFKLGEAGLSKLSYWLHDTWFPTDTTDAANELDEEGRRPFAPTGIRNRAFAYGNRFLKRARHGLIDRFGLPDGVRELDERRFRERLETVTEGVEAAQKLIEMGADSLEEAKILQDFLTGEIAANQIQDKEWASLAEEVQASIEHMGMEAVNLGFVSMETYQQNKGTWLHRAYYEHESYLSEGDSLQRWIGQTLRGAGRGIRGDAFKGRGIFMDISQRRLLRDVPRNVADRLGWGEPKTKVSGKPDNMLLGARFKIFDQLVDENATMLAPGIPAGATPTKIKRRIYWPADEEVPASFGNYELRGDFVVRNVKGKNFNLWRDYNKKEREQMGEIMDARYNIIKTFQLLSRDLANGRFFKSLSENPEWTWDEKIAGPIPTHLVADKSDKLRNYFDADWVLVPDTPVSKTKGVKKWGALAGRYVKMEVWKDISEISEMNSSNFWTRIMTEFKLNKTARNPVVHMNNVMSNFALMDLLDIRARDLVEGTLLVLAPGVLRNPKLKSLHPFFTRHHDPDLLAEMRSNGAFGHSLIDLEITGDVMDPIARELRDVMGKIAADGGKQSMFTTFKVLNVVSKLWTGQTELYRKEDEVFRAATVIRKLQQGYSMSEAARMGREQFLNYDIRAPWVNAARRTVLPFVSYTYRAVPAITQAIMRKPWKLAKYIVIAEAANALAYAVSGGDEEYERGSLRKEVQGDISFGVFPGGVPRMIRLPANDDYDRPQFLDIRRWIPAGDVFDLHNASPLPIPTWMQFAGPLSIASELASNRSAFTGQDIVDPLADSLGEKGAGYVNHIFQSMAPSAPWIPGSWYWNRIAEAGKREDPVGRTNSRGQAVMQSFGIKVSSQDPELGYVYKVREFESTARALKGQLNKARRDFTRNIINEKGWQEAQNAYRQKMGFLQQQMEETFAPYVEQRNAQPPSEFENESE